MEGEAKQKKQENTSLDFLLFDASLDEMEAVEEFGTNNKTTKPITNKID